MDERKCHSSDAQELDYEGLLDLPTTMLIKRLDKTLHSLYRIEGLLENIRFNAVGVVAVLGVNHNDPKIRDRSQKILTRFFNGALFDQLLHELPHEKSPSGSPLEDPANTSFCPEEPPDTSQSINSVAPEKSKD